MANCKADYKIGLRAFLEVTRWAYARDYPSVRAACEAIPLGYQTVYSWSYGAAPSAGCLQKLDAIGLNVHYILSGSRK